MIKLLSVPEKKIPVIKILRDFYGVGLGAARVMASSTPVELPDPGCDHEESKLRVRLRDAGCELEKDIRECRHIRLPLDLKPGEPFCGSMESVRACGTEMGFHLPKITKQTPPEIAAEVIKTIDCPKCLKYLKEDGYLQWKTR